ncbi:MAG: flagellar hook-associated protein FlgK [Magnetococcales bacterium]|nr:flagellar hook-associated protein FlgK [Magnetococcales bacterium]
MGITDILNSSKLGLFASQGALKVVSNNVSNANTLGYSRQAVNLEAVPQSAYGRGAGGNGVQITSVTQQVSEIVDRQLQVSASETGRLDARDQFLTQIQNVFNDLNGQGFSSKLEAFFTSVGTAADNPANTVARAQVVSDAQSLTLQANKMHENLTEAASPVDKEITNQLSDLNSELRSFQDLNAQVVRANAAGTPPLDLLDQRQQLLGKLSKTIDVQVLAGNNGSVALQTRSGLLLTDDKYVAQFSRNGATTATGFAGIGVDGGTTDVTGQIGGGSLKGLVEIRDQVINGKNGYLTRMDALVNELRFQANVVESQSVAPAMNASQTGTANLGKDLATPIGSLATDPTSPKYQGSPVDLSRVQAGTVTFAYGPNANNLTQTTVSIDPKNQSLQQIVDALNASPAVTASITTDNHLQISSKTSPGVYGVVSDTSHVLAALGVGTIFGGSSAQNMAVNPELLNDPNQLPMSRVYQSTDATGNPIPRFDDAGNAGLLALGTLRTTNFALAPPDNNLTTLSAHYADIAGDVGVVVSQNNDAITAQKSATEFLQQTRDSISGVSMEEELTDLVKYQRAFQASSKMVSVTDELMQSIISMAQ